MDFHYSGKINADFALTSGVHTSQGCFEGHDGRCKSRNDGSRIALEWRRVRRSDAERTGALDEGTRIYIHPTDAGQYESEIREGTGSI